MRWKLKKKTRKLLANVTAKLDKMNLSDCDSCYHKLNHT